MYLVGPASKLAEALAARLRTTGLEVVVAPECPEDASHVVFLDALSKKNGVAAAAALALKAFTVARIVARNTQPAKRSGLFVTVQDLGGDFGLKGVGGAPWTGGLSGLVKSARLEWEQVGVKAIDIARTGATLDQVADRLFDELTAGGVAFEVAIDAQGRRYTLGLVEETTDDAASAVTLSAQDVLIATGGARGVTAACLLALARRQAVKMAILGRTALEDEPAHVRACATDADVKKALLAHAKESGAPLTAVSLKKATDKVFAARDIRANLEAMRALGCDARYYACDVSDLSSLTAVLDRVRAELGAITLVVHGAGVLQDRLIQDKTDEQFRLVLETKVTGLQNLLAATQDDPLRFFSCFSSVAARFGNRGQVDYAMANEILNKVSAAERQRRNGACRFRSINWGPWAGGMVDAALSRHFEAQGIGLIPLNDGADAFVDELTIGAADTVECVIGAGELERWAHLPPPDAAAFPIWVHDSRHHFLDGHRIDGVVLLPLVMFHEWALRVGRFLHPEAIAVCRDIRASGGVRLTKIDAAGNWLRIAYQTEGADATRVALYEPGVEKPRFTAVLRWGDPLLEKMRAVTPADFSSMTPYTEDIDKSYSEVLFHDKAFRVLDSIESTSDKHIVGALKAPMARLPGDEQWFSNPLMLDGGYQIALVWIMDALHQQGLPVTVEGMVCYEAPERTENSRCELHLIRASAMQAKGDILYFTPDGKIIAAIVGSDSFILDRSKVVQ